MALRIVLSRRRRDDMGDGNRGCGSGGIDIGRRPGRRITGRTFLGFLFEFSLQLRAIPFEMLAATEAAESILLAAIFLRFR